MPITKKHLLMLASILVISLNGLTYALATAVPKLRGDTNDAISTLVPSSEQDTATSSDLIEVANSEPLDSTSSDLVPFVEIEANPRKSVNIIIPVATLFLTGAILFFAHRKIVKPSKS